MSLLSLTNLQLFTDLVFADFLVTYTPHISEVVFQWVITSLERFIVDAYLSQPEINPLVRIRRNTSRLPRHLLGLNGALLLSRRGD